MFASSQYLSTISVIFLCLLGSQFVISFLYVIITTFLSYLSKGIHVFYPRIYLRCKLVTNKYLQRRQYNQILAILHIYMVIQIA